MTNLKDKLHEKVYVPEQPKVPLILGQNILLTDYLKRYGHLWDGTLFTPANSFSIKGDILVVEENLIPSEPSYLLTPLELRTLLEDAFEAGYVKSISDSEVHSDTIPDKDTYINTVIF